MLGKTACKIAIVHMGKTVCDVMGQLAQTVKIDPSTRRLPFQFFDQMIHGLTAVLIIVSEKLFITFPSMQIGDLVDIRCNCPIYVCIFFQHGKTSQILPCDMFCQIFVTQCFHLRFASLSHCAQSRAHLFSFYLTYTIIHVLCKKDTTFCVKVMLFL